MVAEDFFAGPQVRQWLDGVEPTWTLLTFDGLRFVICCFARERVNGADLPMPRRAPAIRGRRE